MRQGGVPGVWDEGGWWEGLYRVPTQPPPGPILSIFSLKVPTHGQMKVNLRLFDEVSQIDLRLTSDCTQNDPQIDPPGPLPDRSPDGPQIPISGTSDIPMLRIGTIYRFIDHC